MCEEVYMLPGRRKKHRNEVGGAHTIENLALAFINSLRILRNACTLKRARALNSFAPSLDSATNAWYVVAPARTSAVANTHLSDPTLVSEAI